MAQIGAAMAMTHSPGLTGWFDRAPKSQQTQALQAMTEMRERLGAARPDVIVAFSNDHLLNWPINNTPEYTVGIDAEHVGPADWYDEWLALDKYKIPGHPALARYIVNEGARRRLAFSYLRRMQFDDGISVPMHYLNPASSIPLVPVTMNCTMPPIPTPERAYHVGTTLREMLMAYPGDARIALPRHRRPGLTSGGARATSGWTRSSTSGSSICEEGRPRGAPARVHLERMEACGLAARTGALAWILVMAFTRGPAEVLAYMPAIAWRSGTGMVIWNELAS